MPLLKGKSNIGKNIKTEEKAGKSHAQSLAIALNVSRMGKKPHYAKGGRVPDESPEPKMESCPHCEGTGQYQTQEREPEESHEAKEEHYEDSGEIGDDRI